jgi:hypothetical protein
VTRFLACSLIAVSSVASADPYDFRIYKLGNPQCGALSDPMYSCATAAGAPMQGTGYTPRANGNFRVFVRQFAAAMSSVTLMPPETLGHAGFAFSAEVSIVVIDQDPAGVEGIAMPTQSTLKSPLKIPSVHIRKGLPYSFELGARIGWIEQSRMFTGMLELKWAINEGFTYLPDIAVGGRVAKLINSRDVDITTGGLDVSVGKQFALAGMVTLTPYAGWNLMFVGATSNPVDFDPQRSIAQAEQPSDQFRDIYVYDSVQASANTHNRFYGGVRFIASPFMIGLEFSYTLIGSFRDDAGVERKIPSVIAGNGMIGVDL